MDELTIKRAEKIREQCFWGDYSLTVQDILRIAENGTYAEKKFLFQKIIYNASFISYCLGIFQKEDLKTLFNDMVISFRKNDIERKILLSKAVLLDEKEDSLLEDYRWKQ